MTHPLPPGLEPAPDARAEPVRPRTKKEEHPFTKQRAPRSIVGRSVLLVEDDAASRKLVAVVLTEAGALVTAVESAEEALSALARARPEVIVLDLVLPRMGGLVLVEQLKTDPATRDIVIIAVTSLNGPHTERVALRAGCAAYLRKPIDTQTFAATVASHLRG